MVYVKVVNSPSMLKYIPIFIVGLHFFTSLHFYHNYFCWNSYSIFKIDSKYLKLFRNCLRRLVGNIKFVTLKIKSYFTTANI